MTQKDDPSGVQSLGSGKTAYPNTTGVNPEVLEKFPNQFPHRKYNIMFESDEFTSLCPKTAQPDFATIRVDYVPDEWCVESKGLKLYLFSYRSEGSFMETITNNILQHLVNLVNPHSMTVTGYFAARGGIKMEVVATHTRGKTTIVESTLTEKQG